MAKIDWDELGLEEDCYSCRGIGHKCKSRFGCDCREKVPCDNCNGIGKLLTRDGYEFLEFLARHQKVIEETKEK